jgi:hypothetical protein
MKLKIINTDFYEDLINTIIKKIMTFKDPIKRKEYHATYYLNNKNEMNERAKNWKKNNKEKAKEINKKCLKKRYYKYRKEIIKKTVEYERKKLKTDINWVLKKRLRARLKAALKGISKSKKTMELLGVPHINFFKTWIECKFKEGMTWENKHLWHIDHVLPCSSFDLTKPEEQAKCFHYTNLQPLWASENLSKGNRIS